MDSIIIFAVYVALIIFTIAIFLIALILLLFRHKVVAFDNFLNTLRFRKPEPIVFNLNEKEMAKLQTMLEGLGIEQRLWVLKNLMQRPCRIFLSADKQGLYIDGIGIHESFVEQEQKDKSIG